MKESNNKWTDIVRDKVNGLPEVLIPMLPGSVWKSKIQAFYRIRFLKRTGPAAACAAAILVPVLFKQWRIRNHGAAGPHSETALRRGRINM